MTKRSSSPRRLLGLLLMLTMTLALFGCGRGTPDSAQTAAPAGAESAAPAAAPASESPAVEDAAAPGAGESGYFLTAEYKRLYFAPADGSAMRLLADNSTVDVARGKDGVYASFEDGSVLRLSFDGRESEELIPAGGRVYRYLVPFEGGVLGLWYSFLEGAGCDLCRAGSHTVEPFTPGEGYLDSYSLVAGRYLYCLVHDGDPGSRILTLDPVSLEVLRETPADSAMELLADDEGVLCFLPNSGKLYRLDEDTGALNLLDLPIRETDCELLFSHNGTVLVKGNYSDNYRSYLVSAGGRREISIQPDYYSLADTLDGRALIYHVDSGKSAAGDERYYIRDIYRVLDPESGELRDFPVQGRYGALFAGGDFPVMDSSTARKPVTADIYAFFCESTGAGGAQPLCSTTHNAWLNIADRAADVALLAAPTQEEQDYLAQRGVTVEMKLYGGDGLVFIGNRACGVENLTLDQVRSIYRGEITNWSQLGGADAPIRVLYRDDQSGSQRLFERMLWADETVPDFEALGFQRLDEMSTIVGQCLQDPYSLGYSIMTYLNDVYGQEELLSFSLEGYAATPENVAAKTYPLGTRGYVVIRGDEPEGSPARRLFDWFGSPLSDVILRNNGVTPLKES